NARERGEEAGHRAAMPEEDSFAAAVQHQAKTPRERPPLGLGHHLDGVHVVATGEEVAPAAELGRRAPEIARRGCRSGPLDLDLRLQDVGPRIDAVAGSCRRLPEPGRSREAERPEEALLDEAIDRLPGHATDDLAEQGEGEVRVVPVRTR